MTSLSPDQKRLKALLSAYLKARYDAAVHGQAVPITIGQASEQLSRVVGDRPWAIITPFNPAGKRLPDEQNADRLHSLRQALAPLPVQAHPAVSSDPKGRWPREDGLLISGIEEDRAAGLAFAYGQHALVAGRGPAPARLVLLGPQWREVPMPAFVDWIEKPSRVR